MDSVFVNKLKNKTALFAQQETAFMDAGKANSSVFQQLKPRSTRLALLLTSRTADDRWKLAPAAKNRGEWR